MKFLVLKDIYWDNWGTDTLVAQKGDVVDGKLCVPFNANRPHEYAVITIQRAGGSVSDFADKGEVSSCEEVGEKITKLTEALHEKDRVLETELKRLIEALHEKDHVLVYELKRKDAVMYAELRRKDDVLKAALEEKDAEILRLTALAAKPRDKNRNRVEGLMFGNDGGYIVVERLLDPAYPDSVGKVRLPGGRIEDNESPEQALIRELHEEYEVQIAEEQLVAMGRIKGRRGYVYRFMVLGEFSTILGKTCSEGHQKLEASAAMPPFWV